MTKEYKEVPASWKLLLDDQRMSRCVQRLSYEIITQNGINERESQVYQQLLELLDIPSDVVSRIETEVNAAVRPTE